MASKENKKTASGKKGNSSGAEWTAKDVNRLWNGSLGEVAKKLKRTIYSISVARTKFSHFKPGTGLKATDENLRTPVEELYANMEGATPLTSITPLEDKPKKTYTKRTNKKQPKIGAGATLLNDFERDSSMSFKMTYDGRVIELPKNPRSIKVNLDGLELNF